MMEKTYSFRNNGTVVQEGEKKDNLLIYDSQRAHGAYIKKMLGLNSDYKIISHEVGGIENINGYLDSNRIAIAVLFIDSRERLYELLPFLEREIHLILCIQANEIRWLQAVFPNMFMLDIETPKGQLFYQIKLALSRFH